VNDFRRRFFSQVRLFPWCGGEIFPFFSPGVGEENEETRRLSGKKSNSWCFLSLRSTPASVLLRLHQRRRRRRKSRIKDDRRDGEREKGNIYPISTALALSFSRERNTNIKKKEDDA